jgi:hypothetical protein
LIVVKLISGLGNQLFQYALGRQLSLLKKDQLMLDTSFYKDQSLRAYKLDRFDIKADVISESQLKTLLHAYQSPAFLFRVFRKLERNVPKHLRRVFMESELWGYEPDVWKISGKTYLNGYWQHREYFESIHSIIFQELRVKSEFTKPFTHYYQQLESDNASVSLHIRRGDYITDQATNDFIGVLPLSYYRQAIDIIKGKVPNPSFYVFSDDLDWAKEHLQLDGVVHFMDLENGSCDYIELELMSKCRHNIIANSSFSWWGAFLNQNQSKIVISPAQWLKRREVNDRVKIQMSSWTKI